MSEGSQEAPSSSEEEVRGVGPSREILLKRAADMRRNPSEPERRLWMQLRSRRFADHKFRRQAIMGSRIVDFFCPAKGLVIEVDGETHDRERDLARDALLERRTGFRLVRFTNDEVMRNIEGVMTKLAEELAQRADRWPGLHHPPAPSSEEEGEL